MKARCPKCQQQYELPDQGCETFTCIECGTVFAVENENNDAGPGDASAKAALAPKKIILIAGGIAAVLLLLGILIGFCSCSGKDAPNAEQADKNPNAALRNDILAAIKSKDTIRLSMLLKQYDVHQTDASGNTLLIEAVRSGNTEIVQVFLIAGYQINHKNNIGETVLLEAARNNDLPMVKFLLQNGAYVRVLDHRSDSIWGVAAEKGCIDIIRFLCNRNQGLIENSKKESSFIRALKNKHFDCAKILLSQYKEEDIKKLVDSQGNTVPMISIQVNNFEMFKMSLSAANINAANKSGENALYFACQSSNVNFLNALLDNNVSLTYSNVKQSPLFTAVEHGNLQAIDILSRRTKPDFSIRDASGSNVLMYAVQKGDKQVIKKLLDLGKINLLDKNAKGLTAYDIAVQNNNESVRTLLYPAMSAAVLNVVKGEVKTILSLNISSEACHKRLDALLEKNKSFANVVSYIKERKHYLTQLVIKQANAAVEKAIADARADKYYESAVRTLEAAIKNNPQATNLDKAREYRRQLQKNMADARKKEAERKRQRAKYDNMSQYAIEKDVKRFIDKWLTDMRLERDTSSYWLVPSLSKKFYSVTSWRIIGVSNRWLAWNNTVIVHVNSSTKGGYAIQKNWKIMIRRNNNTFEWQIISVDE